MVRILFVMIGSLGTAVAMAQPSSEPIPVSEPIFLQGKDVSRPLQPVGELPPVAPATTSTEPTSPDAASKAEDVLTRKGLPSSWSRYELLMWYPKAMPLPPLVTVAPGGLAPVLGQFPTTTLLGGRSLDNPMSTGGRFTWGSSNAEADVGYEISYFFTGSRSAAVGFDGAGRPLTLGRPVVDSSTGAESFVSISTPGKPGQFLATSVNRMSGWEVNGVWNLGVNETSYLHFIGGYRYFLNHEGVRLEQTTITPLANGQTMWANTADQFDGHTRFHGGQIGLEFGADRNHFFLEGATKVAFGRSFEVVNVGGQTNLIISGQPGPTLAPLQGGVLAQSTNTGRVTNSAFAVLPEGQLRFGYRFRDHSRFYVGYNVIYLSDAVRAGDQIDRTINLSQVVAINNGIVAGGAGIRPQLATTRTDFWVQGINLGFEWTY